MFLWTEHFTLIFENLKLKPGQNRKGQKIFQLHGFLNTFLQLAAEKKYSKNGAAGNFFGPSFCDGFKSVYLLGSICLKKNKVYSRTFVPLIHLCVFFVSILFRWLPFGWFLIKIAKMDPDSPLIYCKLASSHTSHLEAHPGFFRLLMKVIFLSLCTVTFWQKH